MMTMMMNDDDYQSSEASMENSSWQRRVYLASKYVISTSKQEKDVGLSSISSCGAFDNTSTNQCAAAAAQWMAVAADSNTACDNASLPRLLLLWTRALFYKVVRHYGAAPLMLILVPLVVGLFIGVLVGRRWEQRNGAAHQKQHESSKEGRLDFSFVSFASIIVKTAWNQLWAFLFCTPSAVMLADEEESLPLKEDRVRRALKSDTNTQRESGVDLSTVPKHVAVIMDGNRRYGKARYGDATKGHWDGSRTLVDFAKWCLAEGIQVLTVYAFSTENWSRDPAEVASLMQLFCKYCDELRVEAIQRNIRLHVLSSDADKIPSHVAIALKRMVDETRHCKGRLCMNICLSYGSRGEIVNVCRELAAAAKDGTIQPEAISENDVSNRLLTSHCPDPDLVIRTSGEYRLSNFLLWQLAYSEMIFLSKQWPEVEKDDLVQIIRAYSHRRRRFGK